MKVLMSINYKFMSKSPKELIDIIKKQKSHFGGFEVCININNDNEVDYLRNLAFEAHRNNLILQMHGITLDEDDKNFKYLDIVSEVSNIMQSSINIVYHSIYNQIKEKSIEDSITFFNKVNSYIKQKKYSIILSIENLNDLGEQDRLNKDDLIPILELIPDLKFTYDIGHELIDYGRITDLKEILLNRLINVHIHTFYNSYDHQILTDVDKNKIQWIKGITYLKIIGYDNTLVLEYDFNTFKYDSFEDKVIAYLKSIDLINEYFYD